MWRAIQASTGYHSPLGVSLPSLQQEGHAKGHAKGLAKGFAKGLAKGLAALATHTHTLTSF